MEPHDDEYPTPAALAAASTCCPTCSPPAACSRGFFAIIAAARGASSAACVAMFVAAILDGLDGRVARLTNTQSEFGVQYDSLADLVSFGMAPALVMYHWSLSSMKLDGATPGKIGWLAAFLYAACAALRLARFNSQVGARRQALVHRPGQSGRGGIDGQLRLDLRRCSAGRAKQLRYAALA